MHEYDMIYITKRFVVVFDILGNKVSCTVYDKAGEDWIIFGENETTHNGEFTDKTVCLQLLKGIHKKDTKR